MDYRKKLDESVKSQKKINRAFPKDGLSFLCASSNERNSKKLKKVECKQKYKLKIEEHRALIGKKLEVMIAGSKEKLVTERGITLLALIITVVIMIILAAVTINVTLGDGGLVDQAKWAAEVTVNSTQAEQEQLASLEQELANILAEDSQITPPNPEEPSIPETETQVANYADVDGNGTVDGVIYADLAIGGSGSGLGQSYTIPKGSNFKKYEVTQESYSGSFGTGQVIAPVSGSSGNERFYVMALENAASGTYQFWSSGGTSVVTSTDFGTGESNTAAMKAKSGSSRYLWGISAVQSGTWNGSSGWYVPSQDEWAAFADQLDITTSNYSSKGLSYFYWSSSQSSADRAWLAFFSDGNFRSNSVLSSTYVRLGTTF